MAQRLAKKSAVYLFGSVLNKSFGFFLIPLYTRAFTVEAYGTLAILNLLLALLTYFFLMGVSSAAMRFFYGDGADEDYRRQLYGNAFILLLVFPAAMALVAGPLLKMASEYLLAEVPFYPYIFLVILIGLFTPLQSLFLGLLRVQERAKAYTAFTVTFFLVQTLAIIVAVVGLDLGLEGQLYAQIFANVLFWGVALFGLWKYLSFDFSWGLSRSLLVLGLPLIPYFLLNWAYGASGRFALERFASLAEVGLFALAAQFSGILVLFGNALNNALMPHFLKVAGEAPDADRQLGALALKMYAVFGVLSLGIMVGAREAIALMADPAYHEAARYVPYLLFANWLVILYNINYWSLLHAEKSSVLSRVQLVATAVIVGLLFLFLKGLGWGIWGVLAAMIVAQGVSNGIGYLTSQRFFPLRYDYGRFVAVTVLVVGAMLAMDAMQGPSLWLQLALKAALGGVVALAVARLTGLLDLVALIRARRVRT